MRNGFEVTSIHANNGFGRSLTGNQFDAGFSGHAIFPCSPPQQRFWFEEHINPGNPALNVAFRWRLQGEIGTDVLEQAWNVLLARHAALRTSFESVDGEVMQRVASLGSVSIPVIDLRGMSDAEAHAEADRLAGLEARLPFDLGCAPLIRVTRLDVRDNDIALLVTAHHAISDGWSIGILAREMGELCAASQAGRLAELPALPMSYGDYAIDRRARLGVNAFEAELHVLRAALADFKPFEIQADRARPPLRSGAGKIVSRLVDESTANGLKSIARGHSVTLFTVALCGLFAFLHRCTGEDDIWIGSQVSGRDEVEFENLVGCFINTILLRGNVRGDPTFLELLERTRDTVMDALETRHVPIDRIVDIVRPKTDLRRSPMFSVNFIFQRSFIGKNDFGTFVLDGVPASSAGSMYDLNFFMVERPEGWRISCEYDTDLFDDGSVAALLERFATLLGGIVAAPEQTISQLPMLDLETQRVLTLESNRTAAPYPVASTMPQLFEAQVKRTPAAIALVCGETTLSYAQLDAASNKLARELQARGVVAGSRVGVFLERTPDLVVGLLAILKAGAAYVPLDPAYPADRIEYIAQQSRLATTVTHGTLRQRLGTGTPLVLVDADAAAIEARSGQPFEPAATPDDLAYVIFTSGSTGTPKGVEVPHRALVNLLWAMRDRPGLDARDTLVAVTTISFDIAALELYLPLIVGAKLVLATYADVADGTSLLQLLQRSRATALQATPVTWQLLLDAGWRGDPMLKMLCGGEALSRELAARLLAACGGGLWNMYGPTESTIWSSALRIESADAPIPIGPPIANTQFYVLGAHGELMPPGVPGELYIGGDGVARGYFGREDLTQQRFVPDRFRDRAGVTLYRTGDLVRRLPSGDFEFLGRTDLQVKLRGYRIELGEIESALLRQPGVASAVATVGESAAGEKTLWAYVVPNDEVAGAPEVWAAGLRAQIGSFLPAYMVPSPIVALASLPRTPNGKIDRRALPALQAAPRFEASDALPQTPTETRLAATIATLLGYESVGRNANIFDLGFHSLLAVRLATRIAEEFDVKVPVRALFDHPTVAELARRIDVAPGTEEAPAQGPVVTHNPEGTRTPFIYLHSDLYADGVYCHRLATAIGPARPFHSIAPHGTRDLKLLPTIEAMARDYYPRILALQPNGPYRLGGFCASALVAYEIARLLERDGRKVDDVILINASTMPARSIPAFDWILRKVSLDARLPTHLREQFCYKTAMLHEALAMGPAGIARLVRGRLRKWLTRTTPEPADTMAPSPFVMQRGSRETENSFAHLAAAFTYHPKPYDGRITLVWATDQTSDIDALTLGWERLVREVRVVPMTGGHVSPLHERIHELAAILAGLTNVEYEA